MVLKIRFNNYKQMYRNKYMIFKSQECGFEHFSLNVVSPKILNQFLKLMMHFVVLYQGFKISPMSKLILYNLYMVF